MLLVDKTPKKKIIKKKKPSSKVDWNEHWLQKQHKKLIDEHFQVEKEEEEEKDENSKN